MKSPMFSDAVVAAAFAEKGVTLSAQTLSCATTILNDVRWQYGDVEAQRRLQALACDMQACVAALPGRSA